jgi:hypothetical protein
VQCKPDMLRSLGPQRTTKMTQPQRQAIFITGAA